jgi:hypothetical protein
MLDSRLGQRIRQSGDEDEPSRRREHHHGTRAGWGEPPSPLHFHGCLGEKPPVLTSPATQDERPALPVRVLQAPAFAWSQGDKVQVGSMARSREGDELLARRDLHPLASLRRGPKDWRPERRILLRVDGESQPQAWARVHLELGLAGHPKRRRPVPLGSDLLRLNRQRPMVASFNAKRPEAGRNPRQLPVGDVRAVRPRHHLKTHFERGLDCLPPVIHESQAQRMDGPSRTGCRKQTEEDGQGINHAVSHNQLRGASISTFRALAFEPCSSCSLQASFWVGAKACTLQESSSQKSQAPRKQVTAVKAVNLHPRQSGG